MKILVRATNWVGDAILSLPALRALAAAYPAAEIDVLARPWVADLYQWERSIASILPLSGRNGFRDLGLKWQQSREIAARHYDLAVLFPNSFESALLPRLAGVPRIVGYNRDARRVLLTDPIPTPKPGEIPIHQRFYYLEILRRAGIIPILPAVPDILFDGLEAARERGICLFADRGIRPPIIGISPGAAYGGAKRWIPARFAEAASKLAVARGGASIVVFGSQIERPLCQQVADLCAGHNLAGATSLREYLDLTAACGLFLTNDSGAMHVAYASGVPSITVFGPTREDSTGPTGVNAQVIRHPVECSPCMLRECPIDHRCMTGVTVDMVAHLDRPDKRPITH